MSISIRTAAQPLHHSLSFDDRDQYLAEMSDENLFYNEYINEMPTPQKNQPTKGGTYSSSGEQGASPATLPPTNGNRHHVSPYLQKLPHSNFLHVKPPPSSSRQRKHQRGAQHHRPRRSASASRTRGELLDAAYQPTNLDHLDLSSFFSVSNHSFRRPTSAPTRTNSASRKKKHSKASHPRSHARADGFLLTLYRNGDKEKWCCCKASSLNAILQYATEKLRLPSAARRLFNANGEEIYRQEDILANQEYYVSTGENFKDPFKSIQIQSEYGLSSTWTMKGLQMDSSKPKSFTTKTLVSKRLDQQIKTNVNLTMTENGFGQDDAAYHMLIDTVLKDNFDKFLDDATKKLELTAHARKVFNYRGDEIKSLRTFLESDESNMPTAHQGLITGPLWISKGERFRPTGAYVFLQTRYEEFRVLLKKEKQEHREILAVIRRRKRQKMIGIEHESSNNDTTDDDDAQVEIRNKGLLSMGRQEMKQLKESKEQKMKEIRSSMELYKSKMDEIQDEKSNEEALGAKFAIEHIKEIKFEDKIVGRHPLSLIVHENGTFRSSDPTISLNLRNLPSKNAAQTPIEYLLDHLQTSVEMFSHQRPKRVFDLNGIELKLLGQLKSKQHLFISYGEDYRPAFEPCLAIQLHSVDVYDVNNQQSLVKTFRPDDEIIADNEKRSAKQIAAAWVPTETLPTDVRTINYETDLNDDQKQAFDAKNIHDRLNPKALFLHKDKKLIYPELRVTQRLSFDSKSKHSGDKQPPKKIFSDLDLQTWCYNKNGCIYNKQFPSLALTAVPEQPVQLTWIPGKLEKKRKTETLDGYVVQLRPKQTALPDGQIWIFTTDGYIVCKAFLNFALTSLATITPEDSEKIVAHGIRINDEDPSVFFLAICPQCLPKSPFVHRQRWGIRQESTFTIGDWKYSKVENPLWHRMALTWPVDGTGSMIADLQWPVEGSLIPGVPPIKSLKSSQTVPVFVPIRLQVLKNGERDTSKAASVVGPDISNLILEPKSSTNVYRRLRLPEPEKEQRTDRQMKRTADARQREMKLFLENCTSLCNLPFAARRLFDVRGTELFDLTSIERDAHVYVTCGEQWIDPELTKAEQQRRLLLAYLSNDVRMIYFYCALRNPTEYTLSIGKGLCDNSPLILNRCSLNAKQRDRVKQGESIEQVVEHEEPTEAPATELEPKTAHERSHKLMEQRDKAKSHLPWEQSTKKSLNIDTDDDDVVMVNSQADDSFVANAETLYLAKPPRKLPRTMAVSMQKFRWEPLEGYISCSDDPNLVVGVREIEGKVVDVFLKRRHPDDIYQRWLLIPCNATNHQSEYLEQTQFDLTEPFWIASKARPSTILTVLLPACTGNETTEVNISCVGCSITLQQRREEENGSAHQKWSYDEVLGFFYPFNASTKDKEIMAANRANICSYTVNYEALSQPGYIVSILNSSDQSEDVPVCLACAHAMRGKYRLTKMDSDQKFTCAIGKRHDLKFQGPFRCLNHKVDLTHNEAENTLFQRQEQLEQLRQEASVRSIVKELSAAKSIQIVHLLAYRNGDGHTKPGQPLIGSSIIGLLDQATSRLSLTHAARRFYTIDGTVILTIEDLLQWTNDFYKKRFLQSTKTTLLDKVELNTPLPPKNPDSQRRSSLDNQSEKTTFSSKLRSVSPSKQRFQALPKSSDLKRAIKQNSMTRGVDIDMNYLLKFPIEVWVSSGEVFVNPSDIDQRQNQRVIQREQRTTVEHDLETEKHILRLMKGRRMFTQASGELVGQQNSEQPVVKQGHWSQKTDSEMYKQDDVEILRTSLDELRLSQQPEVTRPISSAKTDRLTQYSVTKRVLIYLNGESAETAVQCFGSSLDEISANAKLKWNLMLPIQALFDEHGQLIERFDQLMRDQLVCVSTTKTFISFFERQREVDVKANWARTRNKYGDQATDLRISAGLSTFPQSADPFGPPLLSFDDRQAHRPASKPPMVPTASYRRLAIQQPLPSSTVVQEITPTPSTMVKDSLMLSEEDDTDSEIERIINQKNDQDDEYQETAISTGVQTRKTTNEPLINQSDSDEDDFIRMLKRK